MDKTAEEFVDQLLTQEAFEKPSDTVKPDELDLELPEWFDEDLYNRGRNFYWTHCYAFSTSMLLGLVAVFAVPSILNVLIGTRKSNSQYTAYKRYLSTLLHTVTWFEYELKPGTLAWKSLYTVRSRHLRAGLASKLKGGDVVSQRDLALTQYGFIGFSVLKPDKFGIRQRQEGDWEAYIYLWRVIGHMIGLEDRYNICRPTFAETREVCQILQDRVYTPCLENVPEYFEHMARMMLDGMWSVNPTLDCEALLYWTRYLADVPGYIYTEAERLELVKKLREKLKGKPLDTGVDVSTLISKPTVEGLPAREPRLLYLRDFETIDNSPHYKPLTFYNRYKLTFASMWPIFYSTYLGKLYFNFNFHYSLYLMRYFPYLAFYRFGVIASIVNIFGEDPVDDTKPKTNAEYYNKPNKTSWFSSWLSYFGFSAETKKNV